MMDLYNRNDSPTNPAVDRLRFFAKDGEIWYRTPAGEEYKLRDTGSYELPTGGTDGQALVKASNADYDVTWETMKTLNLYAIVRNSTGSLIPKGKPVMVDGVTGQTPNIVLAIADENTDPDRIVGITGEDIANNSTGEVVVFGGVTDLDTSSYVEDTILYVSSTIAGDFTDTKPAYPSHVVTCALITVSHPTSGSIMVRITKNGHMPDVGTAQGDIAVYDGSAWQKLAIGTDGQVLGSDGTTAAWETPISTIAEMFSGWEDESLCTSTYDWTARTTTISGTSKLYYRGSQIWDLAVDGDFVTSAHDAVTGGYFYYSTDGVTFQWGTSPWDFEDVIVSFVSYDQTSEENSFGVVETHTIRLDPEVHREAHQVIGTYKVSGGAIGGYVLGSSILADKRPSVASTIVKDEDIETTVAAWVDNGPYTTAYLTGSAVFTTAFDQADIGPSGSTARYNLNTGGTWSIENVPNGKHCNYWLLALPVTADAGSQKHRYKWIMGQSIHDTLEGAQQETPQTLNYGNLGGLATEFVIVGVVRVHQSGGNWTIDEVASVDTTRSAIGSSNSAPPITDHDLLDNVLLADTGVTNGHIDDQAQTIYGDKTFAGDIIPSRIFNATSVQVASPFIELDGYTSGVKIKNPSVGQNGLNLENGAGGPRAYFQYQADGTYFLRFDNTSGLQEIKLDGSDGSINTGSITISENAVNSTAPTLGDHLTNKTYVDAADAALQSQINGLGDIQVVANTTERDALTGLDRGDVIHVIDDGTPAGEWRRYQITSIAGGTTWPLATKVVIAQQTDLPSQTIISTDANNDITAGTDGGAYLDVSTKSGEIDHTAIQNIGTNTHAQIDTAITNSVNHIASTSNPHSVTLDQATTAGSTTTNSISVGTITGTGLDINGNADVSGTQWTHGNHTFGENATGGSIVVSSAGTLTGYSTSFTERIKVESSTGSFIFKDDNAVELVRMYAQGTTGNGGVLMKTIAGVQTVLISSQTGDITTTGTIDVGSPSSSTHDLNVGSGGASIGGVLDVGGSIEVASGQGVAIGTAYVGYRLQVVHTADCNNVFSTSGATNDVKFLFGSGGTTGGDASIIYDGGADTLRFSNRGQTDDIVIDSLGDVSITNDLDVGGTGSFTDNITIDRTSNPSYLYLSQDATGYGAIYGGNYGGAGQNGLTYRVLNASHKHHFIGGDVSITNGLDVGGSISSANISIDVNSHEINDSTDKIYIQYRTGQGVQIGKADTLSSLLVYGDTTLNNNLDVGGKLTLAADTVNPQLTTSAGRLRIGSFDSSNTLEFSNNALYPSNYDASNISLGVGTNYRFSKLWVKDIDASVNVTVGGNTTSDSFTTTVQTLTSATSVTWNTANGQMATLTLGHNVAMTISNLATGQTAQIRFIQGASAYTVSWTTTVKWAGGTAPTITTGASAVDIITLSNIGGTIYGTFAQGMA